MTQQTFADQMAYLKSIFGPAEFTQPRQRLIWDDCQDLTDQEFCKIVKHFSKTKPVKYPPLPQDFFDQAVLVRKARTVSASTHFPVSGDDPRTKNSRIMDLLRKAGAKSWAEAAFNPEIRERIKRAVPEATGAESGPGPHSVIESRRSKE